MVNELREDRFETQGGYINRKKFMWILAGLAVASSFVGHSAIVDYAVATAWIICALYLFNKEDFWVLFVPLSIFENTIFFYFTDYTIFKILLLMAAFKWGVYIIRSNQLVVNRYTAVFLVLFIYAIFNLNEFLPGIISMAMCILSLCMMCYSACRLREEEFFKRAMLGFAFFAVAAGIYGMLHGNTLTLTQNGVQVMRFCGTSADPNIMGYKFMLGLAAVWFTDLIDNKLVKIAMGLFLIMVVFRTGSTTALLGMGLLAVMIVLFQHRSVKKTVIIIVAISLGILLLLNVENILIFLSDKSIFGFDSSRLLQQYYLFIGGDLSEATSLRTDIWIGYMEYFGNSQGTMAKLFGGNVTNIYAIEKNFSGMGWEAAAHNTNIDMLMCVGIIGVVVFYVSSFVGLKKDIATHIAENDPVIALRISVKLITYFFAWSLSMFLSYGYMVFFL